jgi:hypothetical protein
MTKNTQLEAEEEDIDRSPPIAILLSGESFFHSAQFLREGLEAKKLHLRFSMPVYYLYCHAIELILKAYLRSKGVSSSRLRSREFGHQLKALWNACLANELNVAKIKYTFIEQIIELLDPFAIDFEFRYVSVGFKTLPVLDAVEDAVQDLLAVVRPKCEAAVVGPIPGKNE